MTGLQVLQERATEIRGHAIRYGLPHPLSRFALHGSVLDCGQTDMIIDAIEATVLEERGSTGWRSARWFLLESVMLFEVCTTAGIDARKLRRHLRRVMRVVERIKDN